MSGKSNLQSNFDIMFTCLCNYISDYYKNLDSSDLKMIEAYMVASIHAIMDYAEKEAANYNSRLYLDVCLNGEYGPAQCFYIKRGYIPDGAGAYYEQEVLGVNAACKNDDELTLCLVKEL